MGALPDSKHRGRGDVSGDIYDQEGRECIISYRACRRVYGKGVSEGSSVYEGLGEGVSAEEA